jgi:hypothetical protein
MQRSTVVLVLVAGALVLLVAGAALVAAFSGNEERFDDGTPERAVQEYLHAIEDQDASAAFEFLAPALIERCGQLPREIVTRRGDTTIRATLDQVETQDSAATVYVDLSETFEYAPFGMDDPEQSLVFELADIEGAWRFTEMPWPLYCLGVPKASDVRLEASG